MGNELDVDIREIQADVPATHPRIEIDAELEFSGTDVNGYPADLQISPTLKCGQHTGLSLSRAEVEFEDGGRLRDPVEVTMYLNLSHAGIERIEQIRDDEKEDASLELLCRVTALYYVENKDTLRRSKAIGTGLLTGRDWEAVLDSLEWQEKRIVEFSIPDSAIGDALDNALSQIERAEQAHDARRYDDALIAVRKAMEKLRHFEDDEELMRRLDSEKRERLSEAIEEFDSSMDRLVKIADLGGHTGEMITNFEGPILRRDSELAVDVGKAYVRYVGQVLED